MSLIEYDNDPNVICLNDAVILHSNRKGIVRYISDKSQDRIAVGIELMQPNPSQPADVSKLFKCKPNHGILVPLTQIARKIMPEELLIQLQYLTNKIHKYHAQVEQLRNKIVQNENQTCCWITNQFLSTNNTHTQQKRHHKHRHKDYVSHRNGACLDYKYTLNEKEDLRKQRKDKRDRKENKQQLHTNPHDPDMLSMSLKHPKSQLISASNTENIAHNTKLTSSNRKQRVGSASKSTNISLSTHHKHVQIKDTQHIKPTAAHYIVMSADETFSNPSGETIDSHIGITNIANTLNSNESSNHIT